MAKITFSAIFLIVAFFYKGTLTQVTSNTTNPPITISPKYSNTTQDTILESGGNLSKEAKPDVPASPIIKRKLDDHSIYLLQRISDRLTGLIALDEQQLRRLETLEYRVTRIESQNLDRIEGIRSTVADMGRRMQDMEREFENTKTALDLLHQDAVGLRRGQVQLRREIMKATGIRGKSETTDAEKEGTLVTSEPINSDTLVKLQLLAPTVYSILGSIGSLQNELSGLRQNLTQISNMTSHMNDIAGSLVTKDYMSILLADAKQESASPAKALLFPQQQLLTMTHVMKQKNTESLTFPEDCSDVLSKLTKNQTDSQKKTKKVKSGVHLIKPKWSTRPFFAYCDMESHGGGWTVFQNRYEGTVDFFRDWQDYKNGFGNIAGEFWLGLEKLHLLTNYKINELLVQLEDFENEKVYAKFSSFAIGSEVEGYQISLLGDYQGDAGDSLAYHVGMKFSTYDSDKDQWEDGNCAKTRSGAWWYRGCEASNLNGRYLNGYLPAEYENQGIYWQDWHGPQYSLMKTRLAIRPLDVTNIKFIEENESNESSSKVEDEES